MSAISDSDPNFNAPSNVNLPSYNQTPRKKRSRITNNQTGSSSSRPTPVKKPETTPPPPCTECGKQFGSSKALFGHMRCHPERQWRGITPPNFKRETNATATPPSWNLGVVSALSEEEKDVVSSLVMMVNGKPAGTSGVDERFECGVGKQVFESPQTLDEHVKGCFTITSIAEDPPPPPPPQETVDQGGSKRVKLVSGMDHRCNICSRVFASGQALGGHMRCHWEKDKEENQVGTIDLNVPAAATVQNLPSSSLDTSSSCSLDLRLGL